VYLPLLDAWLSLEEAKEMFESMERAATGDENSPHSTGD
jgi:hypothetical protein